jgi:hypothetical protein
MDPPHMILHIIDAAKNPLTPTPLTDNAGIVLCLVASTVLLARESTLLRLRAAFVPTKEVLSVPVEMLSQIAASTEKGLRGTSRVRTAPNTLPRRNSVSREIGGIGRRRSLSVARRRGLEVG